MTTEKMTMPRGMSVAAQFFWKHSGWSYQPATETPAQGRKNGALNMAAAEGIAREAGYTYEWQVSDIDSSDFSKSRPAWALYDCIMRDIKGRVVQSLSSCDFGRNASGPYGDYRRVVEAELAAEECSAVLQQVAP